MSTTAAASKSQQTEMSAPGLDHPVHGDRRRMLIIAAHWVVVLIALPIWWYMTSLERLALPTGRIESAQGTKLKFPVHIELDVGGPSYATEQWREDLERQFTRLEWEDRAAWDSLDVRISPAGAGRSNMQDDAYRIRLKESGSPTSFAIEGRNLLVSTPASDPMLHVKVAETMRDILLPYSQPLTHSAASESRIAQYAPRYRLAFTLLNEDASVGGAASGWDVEAAVDGYLASTVQQMEGLHNFTLESQVQFFGPLTFEPAGPFTNDNGLGEWRVSSEELPVFVNSAEWTLTSGVSNDPVLHFILFVPSSDRRPLHFEAEAGVANSDAFIVPQWGSVVIYNPTTIQGGSSPNAFLSVSDLATPFSVFRAHLHALLGVPQLPPNVAVHQSRGSFITPWQLDALKRRRAVENTQNSVEALHSIVSLVKQIDNMPVGKDVRDEVSDALNALDDTSRATSSSLALALSHSIQAFTLSSRAFFNPGMVGLLYFPAEHKYAVYTPLFAPVAVPLIVAVLRELRARREKRKASTREAEQSRAASDKPKED